MQIHILALLFTLQSFFTCQQDQGKNQSVAATLAFSPIAANQQCTEKTSHKATNIIYQSTDSGKTWQDVGEGLPDLGIRRVLADGNEIYVVAETGMYHRSTALVAPVWEKEVFLDEEITDIFPGQHGMFVSSYRKGFFKGIPGTGLWNPMHNALEDKTVRAILETPNGDIFVGCESGIYKSTDSGSSWKHVFTDDGVTNFAMSGDVLICSNFKGLLRSTDGGEHWDWVLTGDGSAFKTKRIEGGFITVTSGGPWQEGKAFKLYTSTDEGKTWQSIDAGLPLVREIYDIVQAGEYLFCSTDAGISRSSDGGKTWELLHVINSKDKQVNLAVSGSMVFAVMVVGC